MKGREKTMKRKTIELLSREEIKEKVKSVVFDSATRSHMRKLYEAYKAMEAEYKAIAEKAKEQKIGDFLYTETESMDFSKDVMIEKYGADAYEACKVKRTKKHVEF